MVAEMSLRSIRERADITREDIVKRARSISVGTVRNAEKGGRVRYDSATQILEALNSLLAEKQQSPVTLADLGLQLF